MKSLRVYFFLCGLVINLHGQESPPVETDAVSSDTSKAIQTPEGGNTIKIAEPRILGNIPDGTPPPPTPPKPPFVVAAKDIRSAITHAQGGRTITVREISPIALPPPPVPPAAPAKIDPAMRERFRAYQASHPRVDLLCLGATIYRSKTSPPRTLVRYWPGGKSKSVTFWSNADFALLAGIHSFVDAQGQSHSILMSWGNFDVDREVPHPLGQRQIPVPPVMSTAKAEFVIVGNAPSNESSLVPIQSLHDLYNREHARLLAAFQGREQARIQHEADLKANPPKPKDIILNYWRTETPVADAMKGGAR